MSKSKDVALELLEGRLVAALATLDRSGVCPMAGLHLSHAIELIRQERIVTFKPVTKACPTQH